MSVKVLVEIILVTKNSTSCSATIIELMINNKQMISSAIHNYYVCDTLITIT